MFYIPFLTFILQHKAEFKWIREVDVYTLSKCFSVLSASFITAGFMLPKTAFFSLGRRAV